MYFSNFKFDLNPWRHLAWIMEFPKNPTKTTAFPWRWINRQIKLKRKKTIRRHDGTQNEKCRPARNFKGIGLRIFAFYFRYPFNLRTFSDSFILNRHQLNVPLKPENICKLKRHAVILQFEGSFQRDSPSAAEICLPFDGAWWILSQISLLRVTLKYSKIGYIFGVLISSTEKKKQNLARRNYGNLLLPCNFSCYVNWNILL